jgi:hypothetical protein
LKLPQILNLRQKLLKQQEMQDSMFREAEESFMTAVQDE